MYGSWDMVPNRRMDWRMDGRIDRWKKWHIEMGAPHKNIFKGKKLYARKLDQAKKNERNNGKEKRTTFLK